MKIYLNQILLFTLHFNYLYLSLSILIDFIVFSNRSINPSQFFDLQSAVKSIMVLSIAEIAWTKYCQSETDSCSLILYFQLIKYLHQN